LAALALASAALIPAGLGACGGTASNDGPSAEELAADYCEHMAKLACGGLPDCAQIVADARAESAASGCAAQFDGTLGCLASKLNSCQDEPQDVCPTEIEALLNCGDAGDNGGSGSGRSGSGDAQGGNTR